ncbi:MAG: hypothetical protein DMG58_29295 [Acidobacteria bacterium]|nr:MAG: hypothetical protein DMG58_29295 [Acidobacteriota bacterium]
MPASSAISGEDCAMASYTMQLRDCMPKPATSGVDDKIYEMQVRICKAFANSSRLRMLDLLAKGERTVSDLQGELGITAANVSQHRPEGSRCSDHAPRWQTDLLFAHHPRSETGMSANSECAARTGSERAEARYLAATGSLAAFWKPWAIIHPSHRRKRRWPADGRNGKNSHMVQLFQRSSRFERIPRG